MGIDLINNNFNNVGIIILAAGRGKRLGCTDIPKVLCKINGLPMVSYVLEELSKGGVSKEIICLVVGFQKEKVIETFGNRYNYAIQEELKGTAHAAHTGEIRLRKDVEHFLVLNGDDSAFYSFQSLNNFVETHLNNHNDITLLTCEKDNPQGLGRIIRNEQEKIIMIKEKENLLPEEETIREISTGTFCFKREWFNKIYHNLKPILGLGEYGLPSFVREALERRDNFEAIKLKNTEEWFGINTLEQLKQADERKRISFC